MLDESLYERIDWKDPVDITKEQWMILLKDEEITTRKIMQILQLIYNSENCMAKASQLALSLGMSSYKPINLQIANYGRRIIKYLDIERPKDQKGESHGPWSVPFWGMKESNFWSARTEKGNGVYWILRPELEEAMRELNATEISLPEEINLESYANLYEGAKKQIYVNSYERNSTARNLCIKHYGTRCIICLFDFEEWYGEIGRDLIHVHHLKPLSEIGETYKVDPVEDLRPVCPNCHVIIHKRNPPYSIDEVRAMMKEKVRMPA